LPDECDRGTIVNLLNIVVLTKTEIYFNRKQKDGKYLIVKDPNKPVIRLYDIPDTTFESEESDGEDEDDIDGKAAFERQQIEYINLVF
jgi:translation initiation factor 3 subunit D